MWWTATEDSKCLEAVYYSGDRLHKWKVVDRLRWRKWKGASGAIAHHTSAELHRQQHQTVSRIFSVVFSNQCGTDPASKQPACCCVASFKACAVHPKVQININCLFETVRGNCYGTITNLSSLNWFFMKTWSVHSVFLKIHAWFTCPKAVIDWLN